MIERACARQVYDDLIAAELTAHLEAATGAYDLIASADTLVYFGDLRPFAAAAAAALRPGGWLIFTVEKAVTTEAEDRGYFLQPHGRYCHTEAYVCAVLTEAGLSAHEMTTDVLRKETGEPVDGIVVTAGKVQ